MQIRLILALLIGKALLQITRKLHIGGGSAAPGLYALKINSHLIKDLSIYISKSVIITGTNGKTTTSRLSSHIASKAGFKVIRNHTGSNLERGIASTLIKEIKLTDIVLRKNQIIFDLAIWELDESAFSILATVLNPSIIVFLNIYRDQLDRYGEINTILSKWQKTVENLDKNTTILINGDDLNLLDIKNHFQGKTLTFGIEDNKIIGEKNLNNFNKIKIDYLGKNLKIEGLKGSSFILDNNKIETPLPGLYHIYDIEAAVILCNLIGVDIKHSVSYLSDFSPAFGRFEQITFKNNKTGYVFLIKNPTGASEVLKTILFDIKPEDKIILLLNDNIADGTDVSWIWDTQFELLRDKAINNQLYIGGSRLYDMALRLKYADINKNNILLYENTQELLKNAISGLNGRLFILPTYTAMLKLQSILSETGIKKRYWEEDINE